MNEILFILYFCFLLFFLRQVVANNNDTRKISHPFGEIKIEEGKGIYFKKENFIFLNENKSRFEETYKIGRKIGRGTKADIFEAHHNPSRKKVAIKITNIVNFSTSSMDQNKDLFEFFTLRLLDHPNILKVYEGFIESKKLYIVMELLQGHNLEGEISNINRSFNEYEAKTYIKEIVSGINYIHKKKYVHRDITALNLMFSSNDDKRAIKIIDFGFATKIILGHKNDDTVNQMLKSPQSMIKPIFTEKYDISNLGRVLYFLYNPDFRYKSKHSQLKTKVGHKGFNKKSIHNFSISNNAKSFLLKAVTDDEDLRPSAESLLCDSWLNFQEGNLSNIEKYLIFPEISRKKNYNFFQRTVELFLTYFFENSEDSYLIRHLFYTFDTLGKGELSLTDFSLLIKDLDYYDEIPPKEFLSLFEIIDVDKDRLIQYTEFVSAVFPTTKFAEEGNIKSAYNFFDQNKNGMIEFIDLFQLFQGNEINKTLEINKLILSLDLNQDQFISYDEFKNGLIL